MAATKTKRSKMPVSKAQNAFELLGEIREIILEEPLRYDQNHWLVVGKEHAECLNRGMPDCGTVGCVAGWVVALKGERRSLMSLAEEKARDILGLNYEQSYELFDAHAAGDVDKAQTKSHALAGAAHIRRFMKAHEAQLKAKAV